MRDRTAARSDAGRVREGNEDRFLVREDRGVSLLAIADGVGGVPGGEVAAGAAVVALGDRFFGLPPELSTEERLSDAIREANTAVLHAALASGNSSAASTLVAAAIRDGHAVIANLGDSRAYLVRDDAPRQLTDDHTGSVAHGITRFVGDPRGVQPDVFVEDVRPGDRLVLCSDGLTRHVLPAEIAAASAAHPDDLAGAAEALVALANSRGGEDNVTVILYAVRRGSWVRRPPGRALALAVVVVLAAVGAVAVLLVLASSGM